MSSYVSIPPDLLSKLDLDAIEVREEFAPDAIAAVLEEMRSEDCVHSWRSFAGDGHIGMEAVDALRAWEQKKRPTAFFMYYGVRAGDRRDLIGAGTVSERVSFDFPYDGFPVIARCYIRRRYRGHGLYGVLLRHRYDYCHARWRHSLNAVHLGSADPKVVRTVCNPELISPPFRRICTEQILVSQRPFSVYAFLSFCEGYAQRLQAAVATAEPDLRMAVDSLLNGDDGIDIFHIRSRWERISEAGAPDPSLGSLLALCNEFTPFPVNGEGRP